MNPPRIDWQSIENERYVVPCPHGLPNSRNCPECYEHKSKPKVTEMGQRILTGARL